MRSARAGGSTRATSPSSGCSSAQRSPTCTAKASSTSTSSPRTSSAAPGSCGSSTSGWHGGPGAASPASARPPTSPPSRPAADGSRQRPMCSGWARPSTTPRAGGPRSRVTAGAVTSNSASGRGCTTQRRPSRARSRPSSTAASTPTRPAAPAWQSFVRSWAQRAMRNDAFTRTRSVDGPWPRRSGWSRGVPAGVTRSSLVRVYTR